MKELRWLACQIEPIQTGVWVHSATLGGDHNLSDLIHLSAIENDWDLLEDSMTILWDALWILRRWFKTGVDWRCLNDLMLIYTIHDLLSASISMSETRSQSLGEIHTIWRVSLPFSYSRQQSAKVPWIRIRSLLGILRSRILCRGCLGFLRGYFVVVEDFFFTLSVYISLFLSLLLPEINRVQIRWYCWRMIQYS